MFGKLNSELYVNMQGSSEFGVSGKLANWDISKELKNIKVPTIVIGATLHTMDPQVNGMDKKTNTQWRIFTLCKW